MSGSTCESDVGGQGRGGKKAPGGPQDRAPDTVLLDAHRGVPVRPLDFIARNKENQPSGPRAEEGPSTRPFGNSEPEQPRIISPGANTLHSPTWVQRPIISYAPAAAVPRAGADEPVPTLAGRYQIESVARRGTVSDTYYARHRVLGKNVVIEVLRPEHASDPEIAAQFLGEARAASLALSAHLVDVLDFGKLADGGLYSILERLEGSSLAEIAGPEGRLPEEKIVAIARQIADGLGAAHAAGLYHGDLSMDQVLLVVRDGEADFVKLRGFGRVGVPAEPGGLPGSKEGGQKSAARWESPEFQRGVQGDVEALGGILYRLCSGLDPLRDKDGSPIPLRALDTAPRVAPGLEAVLLKALSRRGDQRYGTTQDLIADLEHLHAGTVPDALLEMVARSPSIVRAESEPVREKLPPPAPVPVLVHQPVGRSPWPTIAAFAALLVVLGLTFGVLFHACLGSP